MGARRLLQASLMTGAICLFFPAVASADTLGYVCNAAFFPTGGTLGNFGTVGFTLYTGPHCTGLPQGTFWLCSTGATDNVCTTDPIWLAPSYDHMMEMAEGLEQAAGSGQSVGAAVVISCRPGVSTCLGWIDYR